MAMKTTVTRRQVATTAALALVPAAVAYGLTQKLHLGGWMMLFGMTALFGLALVQLAIHGDQGVG